MDTQYRIEDLPTETVIRRGTAEILEQNEEGIFLRDTLSGVYMMNCDDVETAREGLHKHADRNYSLFTVVGKEAAEMIREEYAFKTFMDCHQLGYIGDEIELTGSNLTVRKAELTDLDMIMSNYGLLNKNELLEIIERGKLLIGELDGTPVGFIGEHLEGSMGLLFILPEYRKRGYAAYLEAFKIKETLNEGFIPFGQVVVGNEESLNLQKKLGMTEAQKHIYWLY